MIETILPPEAAAVAVTGDLTDVELFAEEEAVLARAVEKRRREFTTVRGCARRAYAELDLEPAPVVPGPNGEPSWAPGVVGSMTHCEGYRACALARADELLTIGVDAEPNAPLPDGVLADIARPEERPALRLLAERRDDVHWDRLLFSAKESVYKAWFPLARRWLGFEDASLRIDAEAGSFEARLLVAGPLVGGRQLRRFEGRWLARDGIVATAIAVPRSLPVSPV